MVARTNKPSREPRRWDKLPRPNLTDQLLTAKPLAISGFVFLVVIFVVAILLDEEARGLWIGIAIFVLGWMLTAVIQTRDRTKTHTFDLILRTRFEDSYVAGIREIYSFQRANPVITDSVAEDIFSSKEQEKVDLRRNIAHVLNFYEIIAISVHYRDADEFLIREYFNDLMLEAYGYLGPFIPLWRKGDPEAFVYFEALMRAWGADARVAAPPDSN